VQGRCPGNLALLQEKTDMHAQEHTGVVSQKRRAELGVTR
jgi:hypothetical protein